MPPPKTTLSKSVQSEITMSIEHYHWWSRFYGWGANLVTALSIILSFAAGIYAATKSPETSKILGAVLAGLPALLLTVEQSFKFRSRSDWFWNLVLNYQALQRALERGDLSEADASRRIDDIEERANAVDPALAKTPNTPKPAAPKAGQDSAGSGS